MADQETLFDKKRDEYFAILKPLFLPDDPTSNDIIKYFASLLRVLGMEDGGWDPYSESRAVLEDINSFFKLDLPEEYYKDISRSHFRMRLVMYSHTVEMDAPYEVLTNLLRFKLGKGYSPNPFFEFLSTKEQKNFQKRGINPIRKIEIIKKLADEAGSDIGNLYSEFYDNKLRNAIAHSDFILTDEDFRCRGDLSGISGFRITYEELDKILTNAKAFIAAFFQADYFARHYWGTHKQSAMPYDPHYKGIMEVLVDKNNLMCGFSVHWPNGSKSTYRRTEQAIEMTNCSLALKASTLDLFVGRYAQNPSNFSPLVEKGETPIYSSFDKSDAKPSWPQNTDE